MDRRSFFGLGAATLAMPLIGSKVLAAETKKIEVCTHIMDMGESLYIKPNHQLSSGEILKTPPNVVFSEDGKNALVLFDKDILQRGVLMYLFNIEVSGPQSEQFIRNGVQRIIDDKVDILSKLGCHKALIAIYNPITTLELLDRDTAQPDGWFAYATVAIGGWRN